ncbi:hypothetical protein [Urbifossiella limnaea]|uniref:Uncharacterized protein n=1 Tax=Urbifossiella limnaea TaxID=2528023 RepID=A0A517XSX7_9BACT|nr:hypothetical protein [Urbifossiella limnaea]QDU20584.1 hypothetical protein ETAA1_25390 [Urbifossiella limnaea]
MAAKNRLPPSVVSGLRLVWQLAASVREAVAEVVEDDVVDDDKCEEAITHARDIGALVNRILRGAGAEGLGDIRPLDGAGTDDR